MLRSGTVALGLLASAAAFAADGERVFSATPLVGYRVSSDLEARDDGPEIDLKDSGTLGLVLNLTADVLEGDAYTEWELYGSRQSVGIDNPPAGIDPGLEVEITHVLLGGTLVGPGELLRPYFGAGIGAAHLSPDAGGSGSETEFAFSLSGGAQLFPGRRIGARIEARGLGAVVDNDSRVFCPDDDGDEGGNGPCLLALDGKVLWQWEVWAGITARF